MWKGGVEKRAETGWVVLSPYLTRRELASQFILSHPTKEWWLR